MKPLLLIVLSTCFIGNCWVNASSFESTQERVVKAVQANDFKTFIANCSKDGISVVARYADFKYIKAQDRESAIFDFDVSAESTLTWADEHAYFNRDDIKDSPKFRKLFDQFCGYVATTYGPIDASRKEWDEWHQRILCDVVSGKMASNFFWYIFFVKEGAHWRVWRIECAVR